MFRPHRTIVALLILAMLHCSLGSGLAAAFATTSEDPVAEIDCCHHDSHIGEAAAIGIEQPADEPLVPDHRQCLCKGAVGAAASPSADVQYTAMTPSVVPLVEPVLTAFFHETDAVVAGHAAHFPPLATGRLVRALCGSLVI